MKIAMIGTRGVPANYGGFETCVEELGRRLADRGHEVTVYCRESYYKEKLGSYLGMRLVYLPNLKKKSLDTLSHTFFSVFHAIREPFDVLMVFNAANSPTLLLPYILRKKLVINPDGLEWKRGKWGPMARRYYKFSEWVTTKFADRIVADSAGIQAYYRETYGVDSSMIAYGAYVSKSERPELLERFGLKPGGYFLQITRFEPENNPLLTIQAYRRLKTDKKLVIVGGAPYKSQYCDQVLAEAGEDVILPGYIYDREVLDELWGNCHAYIHGNEVGGTNPALLQTMASGCFTIAIDVPFSHDVLRDCGIFYQKTTEDLSSKMGWTLEHAEELGGYKVKAVERIKEFYNWDRVTDGYERVFAEVAAGKRGPDQSR